MKAIRIAMDAYAALVRIPMSADRMHAQHIMAELRDFIAEQSGVSSEEVQNSFAAIAAIERQHEHR